MGLKVAEIVLDCHDAQRLATFYSQLLGWGEVGRSRAEDPWTYVALAAAPDAEPVLVLLETPDPKTVKNRMHLELAPTSGDQLAEVRRAEALGAARVDIGQGEPSWVVMADPEGNEFCIARAPSEVARPGAPDPVTV